MDGTDGPTDADGYCDGHMAAHLAEQRLDIYSVLTDDDVYDVLKQCLAGQTGTNIKDFSVLLIKGWRAV